MSLSIESSHGRTPRSPMTDHTQYREALTLRVVDGAWPEGLEGHVFFTSPDIATGVPVFGSDGMLYRFDLTAHGVMVRSASLRTPSAFAEDAVAKSTDLRWTHPFRPVGLSRLSPALGAVECLTVAPTPVGERLWVTSDSGRPWEVDPVSLKLLTPIGVRADWRSVAPMPWTFPLVLTSGHPAIEPDGKTAWEANFSNMSSPGAPAFFRLLRVVDGAVRSWEVRDAATGEPAIITQSVHQMACTEHHIVVLDAAFHVEARQLVVEAMRNVLPLPDALFARFATEAQRDTAVLWVIDKRTLDPAAQTVSARRYALDGESTHFAASWREVDGDIHVVMLHTPCQDVSEWLREGERTVGGQVVHPDLIGMPAGVPLAHGAVGVHRLHPDGRISSERLQHDPGTWGPALYTLPPGNVDRVDHLWFYTAGFAPDALPKRILDVYRERLGAEALARIPLAEGRPPTVVHVDLLQRRFDVWSPPSGWGVFGQCFVPRAGATDPWDGWIVASALSDRHEGLPAGSKGDELWVFRAQDIAAGPICRLAHPDLNLPFTLHSAWMPRLVSRPAARQLDIAADHDPVKAWDSWAAELAVPGWLKAPMLRGMRCAFEPEKVAALLEREVWPRFR